MGNTVTLLLLRFTRAFSTTIAVAAISACSRGNSAPADSTSSSASATDSANAATPVHMNVVERGNIAITVSGPGQTNALDLQKIRAPFTGTLTSLNIVVGEHVGSGQVIGAVVSQLSDAALHGAQSMLNSAATPTQRSDAQRALVLARQNLVATPLRAPRGGTVVSRGASQGDLVTAGDSIASIAAAGSIVFIARIAQSDLTHVRPGQRATITLPGKPAPVDGVVHGFLPADTSGGMTVPVRIDLQGSPRTAGLPIQTGLFGTAQIVTGDLTGVPIVPSAAVLRDDISGISQVAIVSPNSKAHWVTVTTGASQGDRVQITSPVLTAGERVIVSGQVGLPDGSRVSEAGNLAGVADSSMTGGAGTGAPAAGTSTAGAATTGSATAGSPAARSSAAGAAGPAATGGTGRPAGNAGTPRAPGVAHPAGTPNTAGTPGSATRSGGGAGKAGTGRP